MTTTTKSILAGAALGSAAVGTYLVLPEPPPAPKPVTLEWNCEWIGGVATGIESSTNLTDWKLECRMIAQLTNQWTDTNAVEPHKFYRAFTDWL